MIILVQALFDIGSQNPKIMNSLAEEWEKLGHRVIRFYPCYSRKRVHELNLQENIYSFYFPQNIKYKCFLNQLDSCKCSFVKLLLCCICHPVSSAEFVVRRIPLISNLFDESHIMRRQTERAVKIFNADVVVAGSNPFYFPLGLSYAKVECKRIWYQMDPHAFNGMMNTKEVNREILKEIFVYDHMDRIFVQPNSYSSIICNLSKETAKNVFETKFPLVTPKKVVMPDKSHFYNNTINCVYAGALMLPIRRPEYLLNLFSLFNNKSIHLYIWCGNLTNSMEEELIAMLPDNVSYCGSLPQNEMQSVLAGADFLVNIGNSILNQLPSKVLDYISLRKPIINIYKLDECPTLDILKDYPLSISVSEDESVELSSIRIEKYILENIGKSADLETIEINYHEYLPNTVARYVLET